ncbi:hypothetical protein CCAX7_32010 [Capsulimonas corticalis]|uniref:Uncharacterized protein n=1 Tax=Capsulimonas corticalis TaxID=2219043 RepID=A0A402D485_9BACT|nr:ABC transporter permease [Capsulimonas corticalis]BDI31150.1 hypothetical protein CCAX7_32010 [Capsulimonas corticalis]
MSLPAKVYSAESPLRRPRQFLRDAAADLLASRETARRWFQQTIAQRYRYSSLGLLWAVAPPVAAALLTFGKRGLPLAHTGSSTPPQFYAVFGLMLAQTFLETFNTQRNLFSGNRHLLGRQKTATEGLILAGAADNAVGLGIKLAVLAIFAVIFHTPPTAALPLGLLGVAAVGVLGSGLGLLFAPASALKPDLDHIMTFFPWILFGLTPVFVQVPSSSGLHQIYRLNPLTSVFEAARAFTYGDPAGHGGALAASVVISVALFLFGALFCRVSRPFIVERFLK